MKQIKLLSIMFAITISVTAQTTYYVSNKSGNDSNNGKTETTPWKSIAKVNSIIFKPGDKILFKRNNTWFETLIPRSSGANKQPIIYSSYGKGKRPAICGSDPIKFWIYEKPNIYKAELSKLPKALFFELSDTTMWGIKKTSLADLTNERDYYIHELSKTMYVVLHDNHNTKYKGIYGSVREWGIFSHYPDVSHNTIFENFELKFSIQGGIRTIDDNYVTIRNIKSHHHGGLDEFDGQGIQVQGQNCNILNNYLYENGQHGIYVSFYSGTKKTVENILIEGNKVWDNYHTGIDIMNDRGLPNGLRNLIIRYNTVWDSPDRKEREKDVSIQTLSWGEGTIDSVLICYNKTYNSNGISFNIHKRSNYIKVYNNLSYGANSYAFNFDTKGVVDIKNNICVGSKGWFAVALDSTDNINMDNNIWNGGLSGVILRRTTAYKSQKDFYNQTGMGKNSIFGIPDFVDADNLDFRLKANSIGINSGTDVGLEKDFNGKIIINKPAIGIFEFQEF